MGPMPGCCSVAHTLRKLMDTKWNKYSRDGNNEKPFWWNTISTSMEEAHDDFFPTSSTTLHPNDGMFDICTFTFLADDVYLRHCYIYDLVSML